MLPFTVSVTYWVCYVSWLCPVGRGWGCCDPFVASSLAPQGQDVKKTLGWSRQTEAPAQCSGTSSCQPCSVSSEIEVLSFLGST